MGDDASDELLLRLTADPSGLKQGLADGGEAVSEFAGGAKEQFSDLQKDIAEIFGAEKLKEAFTDGVEKFADFQKTVDLAQINLSKFGKTTADSREQMANWSEEIQATTLFTKDQAITTLNSLITKTGDLGASLKLSKLAMDVSAGSGRPLQEVIRGLSNAYEGNNAGLSRLLINFPLLKQQIDAGGDAVALLQQQFGGMAKQIGEDGLAGDLTHMKEAWSEVMEKFAKDNQGAIKDATHSLTDLAGAVSKLLTETTKGAAQTGSDWGYYWAKMAAQAKFYGDEISATAYGIKEALHGQVEKGFKDTADRIVTAQNVYLKTMQDTLKAWQGQYADTWKAAGEDAGQKFSKALTEGTLKAKKDIASQDQADAALRAAELQKETLAYNKYNQGLEDSHMRTQARIQNDLKIYYDWVNKAELATGDDLKAALQQREQAYNTYLKDREAADKQLKTAEASSEKELWDFAIGLAKTGNKDMVELAKDAGVVKAVIDTAVGISNALSYYPYPESLLVGAAVAAEGATEIAKIEGVALAAGGVVTSPTHALIGEGGEPEAVVPLSKAGSMGFGGGNTNNYHLNGPIQVTNARNAAQFVNELPHHVQRMNSRLGLRGNTVQ